MRLYHERSFFENRKKCSPSELHGGGLFRTFNSYSFNFNGGLRKQPYRLLSSNFQPERQAIAVIFQNWPLAIAFISSLSAVNFCFLMCLLRINLPNLCPDMNHFDPVDFSECHSEAVISFLLTLSVLCAHYRINMHILISFERSLYHLTCAITLELFCF